MNNGEPKSPVRARLLQAWLQSSDLYSACAASPRVGAMLLWAAEVPGVVDVPRQPTSNPPAQLLRERGIVRGADRVIDLRDVPAQGRKAENSSPAAAERSRRM
jgi:hypothetical protein